METALVTALGSSTSQAQKAPSQELDKNAFLMLLVAQLKSQDPTQSQDPNQMVQQMATFSSLEQVQNTNRLLEGIQLQNQGLFQTQAASLVGKRVRVTSGAFELQEGKALGVLDLPAEATVTLTIKDANGKVVRVMDKGTLKAGDHALEWDGRDAAGNVLPDGAYTLEAVGLGTDGKPVAVTTSTHIRVDAVTFQNGTAYLLAGGRRFNLSDVHEISA
ncbi:MAG: Basal-body rod modification protein FlgD [Acidobacteria bacterium ADurb.Bin340]|nr:MAG: Basal-body rod modification protein FlgD [Acidobacteria bacterium ADurb.Bin340]